MRAVSGHVARWQIAYTFPMEPKGFRQSLTFSGKVQQDASFRGKKMAKETVGASLVYDNKEKARKVTWVAPQGDPPQPPSTTSQSGGGGGANKLEPPHATKVLANREEYITIELATAAMPANTFFEVSLAKAAPDGGLHVAYAHSTQVKQQGAWRTLGALDAKGVFRVTLGLATLPEYARGDTVEVQIMDPRSPDPIADLTIKIPKPEAPAPSSAPEDEPLTMDDARACDSDSDSSSP